MFCVDGANFDVSPVSDSDDKHHESPVSPITITGKVYNREAEEFHPKFVESPGFSPIRPPKTPIRKILRRSQEESYIQG